MAATLSAARYEAAMVTADIWPVVDMRPLPESAVATTAAATEDDGMVDVAGDTAAVVGTTTLEVTTLPLVFFDCCTTGVVAVTEDVAIVTVTPVAADAVAALLRPFLREADIGAVAGAAGGGRLLTKGLLLSRSARR